MGKQYVWSLFVYGKVIGIQRDASAYLTAWLCFVLSWRSEPGTAGYFSRMKMAMGVPVNSHWLRILFSKKRR